MLLLLTRPIAAQYHHFESISESDGLSDNRITCFLKDHTGFMWIGTENGLNRYDGNEFRIYRPGQPTHFISHENINDIEEDHHGRLWVATWSGLNVLNPNTDSLYVFTPDEDAYRQKKTIIASSIVWDIYVDDKERLWLGLDIRDLCYYDPATQTFTYFPWKEFVTQHLPQLKSGYRSIQKIVKKSDHELWLGTSIGLFSYDMARSTFRYHGGDPAADFISLVYDSARQRVYFGQDKIYVYDVQEDRLKTCERQLTTFVTSNRKNAVLVSTAEQLWIVDKASNTASPYPIGEPKPFSLHHEKVQAVYPDGESLWLGTTNGVRLYNQNLSVFPFFKVFPDTLTFSSGNVYHVLDHDQDNTYYVSSFAQNCLIKVNRTTGAQEKISFIGGKPLSKCSKTYEDSHHRLWILTERDIFVSDQNHKTFRLFPYPFARESYQFTDMLEDKEGNFWFLALTAGVCQYNASTHSWKWLREEPEDIFAIRPTAIRADPAHQAIWISDFSYGAFRYDEITKKSFYHGMDTNDPRFLQSSLSTSLTLDQQGNIWIATTSGGVSTYSNTEKRFTTYSMRTGLLENTIHAIEADRVGTLWLASSKGLTRMKTNGEIVRHYDKDSGLPFSGFTTPFSINSKGELLIGIANGFLKFHPDSLHITSTDFPVVITSWMQGEKVMHEPHGEFSYHQNEFTINFAALTYSLPHRTKYLYKLDGYDKDWITATDKPSAHYTNLGSGDYTFHVKAMDYNGRESLSTSQLSFTVLPPFWKTIWFMALVAATAAYGLFWWTRRMQRKIHAQKVLNRIATSLYEQNTIEDVFWKVATNCIEHLKFSDCVVYLLVEDRSVLIQKSAAGPKSTTLYQIHNPIEIPLGKGIVGSVALSGEPEIVPDTRKDRRYIVDDRSRLSEIAVPIIVEGKVFGVIDSEHETKNFYSRWHLYMLREIAVICSAKIGRYFVEEVIRSKVARDLHDDIGSTLSSIKIMSSIAIGKNDPVAAQNYLKSISQNANIMQESMSDMVWAINPENDTMEKVIIRMREFAAEILEPLDIHYEFLEEGDFSPVRLNLNTRKHFFLIYKEAVNNVAKYSQCRRVTIDLVRYPNGIVLRIRDDGKGFDPVHISNGSGNGLKNMKHRATSIRGTIQIESVPGSGTSIILKAPIT